MFQYRSKATWLFHVALVIGLFVVWSLLALRIAREAPDQFGRLLATGIASLVFIAAFGHMGVTLGLLPTPGVNLPFVSASMARAVLAESASAGRRDSEPMSRSLPTALFVGMISCRLYSCSLMAMYKHATATSWKILLHVKALWLLRLPDVIAAMYLSR